MFVDAGMKLLFGDAMSGKMFALMICALCVVMATFVIPLVFSHAVGNQLEQWVLPQQT